MLPKYITLCLTLITNLSVSMRILMNRRPILSTQRDLLCCIDATIMHPIMEEWHASKLLIIFTSNTHRLMTPCAHICNKYGSSKKKFWTSYRNFFHWWKLKISRISSFTIKFMKSANYVMKSFNTTNTFLSGEATLF